MTDQNLAVLHKIAETGKLSHAYILEGDDPDGLLSAAKELAKCVLCEGEKKPCGSCKACVKAEKGVHPDILEITTAKDRATIGVETVRALSTDAYILPNEGIKKVYLIHPAESLTEAAQNALLKTIEEPPSHAVFLLLLKEGESLLDTVFSRCVRLNVAGKNQTSSKKNTEAAAGFLKALSGGSEYEFVLLSGTLPKNRDTLTEYIETVRGMFRDLLILKTKSGSALFFPEKRQELQTLSGKFFQKQLVRLTDIAGETLKDIDTNSNISLTGMLFFIKCWEEVH